MANSYDQPSSSEAWLPSGVAFYGASSSESPIGHDHETKRCVSQHIASLLDVPFIGEIDGSAPVSRSTLVVATETIKGAEQMRRLGIEHARQLFGGLVPHDFVATKVITHPLVHEQARAPAGWSAEFAAAVSHVTLPGYAAFCLDDAVLAGERLLAGGSVRLKDPAGVGGTKQEVATNAEELRGLLSRMEPGALEREGIVIERNLRHVTTFSVGLVTLGAWRICYFGTQGLTLNHHGAQVYGGSRLTVARGDEAVLLGLPLTPPQRAAIEQALVYHRMAFEAFPGAWATRCNYDVAAGVDDAGQPHSGVLEQSWRIGGASGAEIAAMHAFRAEPDLRVVQASTVEVYGEPAELPRGARVHYDGTDSRAGRLVKYVTVEPYADA